MADKEVAYIPQWLAEGRPDPFPNYLDRDRSELPMADFSDDALGNYLFMNYDRTVEMESAIILSIARGQGSEDVPRVVMATAIKERLRWLSRKLLVAEGKYPGKENVPQIDAEKVWAFIRDNDPSDGYDVNALRERAMEILPPEFVEEKMQPILERHIANGYLSPEGTIFMALATQQYKGILPGQVELDAKVEQRAEEIYNSWTYLAGHKPWVPRGNSDKQEEARRQARGQLRREEMTPTPPIIP